MLLRCQLQPLSTKDTALVARSSKYPTDTHSNGFFAPLGIAVLCLITAARAGSSSFPKNNDIRCPKGSFTSFVHNSYTYNAPVDAFTNLTKRSSTLDGTQCGGVAPTNTTGTDNVPGATRSGTLAGGAYHETLTAYQYRPGAVLEYSYHGDPYILAVPGQPTIDFAGYAETLRFESICGGTATYIDIITYSCSNHQTLAYSGWYTFHQSVFPGLAATVGAPIMAGDCPQAQVANFVLRGAS
ncbi:hypothetical protein GGX14DRAFT_697531 [Mycena pura]|uniref:Uncharacterized protein n=1 Tax=Mycena pura TaxID=153505 RepID=A0AAD6VED8_9AGAR|nr:hypothetical protein GGX14DRAFT_697531 [Mycena pura]